MENDLRSYLEAIPKGHVRVTKDWIKTASLDELVELAIAVHRQHT
jgi:hypothetical protein